MSSDSDSAGQLKPSEKYNLVFGLLVQKNFVSMCNRWEINKQVTRRTPLGDG